MAVNLLGKFGQMKVLISRERTDDDIGYLIEALRELNLSSESKSARKRHVGHFMYTVIYL